MVTLAICALNLTFTPFTTGQFTTGAPQTPVDLKTDLEQTWTKTTTLINQWFYAKEKRKDELTKVFAKYAAKAKGAKSREEFGTVMNQMIEDFNDSHFGFLGDDTQPYYTFDGLQKASSTTAKAAEMPQIGAWFRPDGKDSIVQMVLEEGQAMKAGVRKGDRMVSIGGKPFTPIRAMEPFVGQEVEIKFRRGDRILSGKVTPAKDGALSMFLDASRKSYRVIENGGKKLAYFHLWCQGTDGFINALSAAVDRSSATDGFILDLRDGFGGRPERYADPFFRPGVKVDTTIQGMKRTAYFGYDKPLVVIINRGSRSAKEVLSYILKKSGRATLVGETTAGAVLGTTPMRVNDWAFIEIPLAEMQVDGITLEKVGVSPDVVVPAEFDKDGKDLMLEKSIEVLKGKIK